MALLRAESKLYGGDNRWIYDGIAEEKSDLAGLTNMAPGSRIFCLDTEHDHIKKADGSWHEVGEAADTSEE